MKTIYNTGDRVRCTGTLKQTDGTLADPTVVNAWYRTPANALTTLTYGTDDALAKDTTGVYFFDLDVDTPGRWVYGFYSTGTGKAASPDMPLVVLPSKRS